MPCSTKTAQCIFRTYIVFLWIYSLIAIGTIWSKTWGQIDPVYEVMIPVDDIEGFAHDIWTVLLSIGGVILARVCLGYILDIKKDIPQKITTTDLIINISMAIVSVFSFWFANFIFSLIRLGAGSSF